MAGRLRRFLLFSLAFGPGSQLRHEPARAPCQANVQRRVLKPAEEIRYSIQARVHLRMDLNPLQTYRSSGAGVGWSLAATNIPLLWSGICLPTAAARSA